MNVPDELRARVARDLEPVRPFRAPWQRAALALPALVLAFAAAPGVLGLRQDLSSIGPLLAWGGSLAQLVVAAALLAAALREAVPGESVSGTSGRALLATSAALTVILALVTSIVSPEQGGRPETYYDWLFCWRGAVLVGAPVLLLVLVLISRGLVMRPGLAGALAGMVPGTAVDGGWRLYCNYSNPSHVLPSHGGAVLALTLVGVVAAVTVARIRQIHR